MATERLQRQTFNSYVGSSDKRIGFSPAKTNERVQPPAVKREIAVRKLQSIIRNARERQNRTLQSLDLKSQAARKTQLKQSNGLIKPINSEEFSRFTKRFPFGRSTRPLLFLRPYAKTSFDNDVLERTKGQLYEQMRMPTDFTTEPSAPSSHVQYLTEYGDQFGVTLPRTFERRPKNLSISMIQDKIMKAARKSRYLQRLNHNFENLPSAPPQ